MMRLFAYGTLMIPEVVEAVAGRVPDSVPATARGYAAYRIEGRVYPGLIRDPARETAGRLYLDLDRAALQALDRFEGDAYCRTTIVVDTDSRQALRCEAYLLSDGHADRLTYEGWDPKPFIKKHGPAYLAMCRAFRAHELSEGEPEENVQ